MRGFDEVRPTRVLFASRGQFALAYFDDTYLTLIDAWQSP